MSDKKPARLAALLACGVTSVILVTSQAGAQPYGGGGGGDPFGGGGGGAAGNSVFSNAGGGGGNLGGRSPKAAQPTRGAGAQTPQVRRPANTFCTEVDLGNLPPGAMVQAVMVMVSRKGKPATQEESDLAQRCFGLAQQHGAAGFAASQSPDSIDLRVPALLLASVSPQQRQGMDLAYAGAAAREQLTADAKGEVQLYVPREDLDATVNLMQGNTVENFGVQVSVPKAGGGVAARTNVFIVGGRLLAGKDRASLQAGKGDLKDEVKWTDAAGQPLAWDGKKFTDAAGHAVTF